MPKKTQEAEEDVANRRRQLKAWIDDHFGGVAAAFIKANKLKNQGEISGLLNSKSFGGARARSLEIEAGMPTRYLEQREAGADDQIKVSGPRVTSSPPAFTAFTERKVSNSQWAVLQAVEMLIPEEELKSYVARHETLMRKAKAELKEKAHAAKLSPGKPLDHRRKGGGK